MNVRNEQYWSMIERPYHICNRQIGPQDDEEPGRMTMGLALVKKTSLQMHTRMWDWYVGSRSHVFQAFHLLRSLFIRNTLGILVLELRRLSIC